jgi:transposase-like protein
MKPIKEYKTHHVCLRCGTFLIFQAQTRIKGGYSGRYKCESCKNNILRTVISDEERTKNKWIEIC